MNSPTVDQVRGAVEQGFWEQAVALLQPLSSTAAADVLRALPFEHQQALFRQLPVEFATRLLSEFPYYDQYVLLHSRPRELRAIIDSMDADDRMRFFDELPEEAWRQVTNELSKEKAPEQRVVERRRSPAVKPAAVPLAAPEVILEARGVEKRFRQPDGRDIQVIAPTDLTLTAGSITALLGPSGSGKSTLLRILSGLAAPSAGEVFWRKRLLRDCAPNVAIVFQSFALFPWLTVLENVEAPLLARSVPHPERHRRALDTLNTVGLKGFETAYPKELSGGMKQRVGFARALAVEPELLFMDEPFSALDVSPLKTCAANCWSCGSARRFPRRAFSS